MHNQSTVGLAKASAASVAKNILLPKAGLLHQIRSKLGEPLVDSDGTTNALTHNQRLHAQDRLLQAERETRQLLSIIRHSDSEDQIYQLAIRLQEIDAELRRGKIGELASENGPFDIQDFLQLSRVQRCDLITVKSFCDELLRDDGSLLVGGKDSQVREVFLSKRGVQGEKLGEIAEKKSAISLWNIKEAKPGFPLVSVEYMEYTDALRMVSLSLNISLSGSQAKKHPLVHLQNLLEMEFFDSGAVINQAEAAISKANGISKTAAQHAFLHSECSFSLRSPSADEAPSHENGWREIIFEAKATVCLNGEEIAWMSLLLPEARLSFEFLENGQMMHWKDAEKHFARVYA